MRPLLFLSALACAFILVGTRPADPVEIAVRKLSDEIARGPGHADLTELVALGPRLSGSAGAERAVAWAEARFHRMKLDRVWLQPVRVTRWERGEESLALVGGPALRLAALGGSAPTPPGGVTAEVVEVHGLEELKTLGDSVRGKIVFFNRPMPVMDDMFAAYGAAGDQRFRGPSVAAAQGATAALVRSLTPLTDDFPHTGVTLFPTGTAPIPAAAVSTRAADTLAAALARGPARVRLVLGCRDLGLADSHNVIAEIRGREKPDEQVAVGGHLDSWDLSAGAHDDGAGVIHAMETLRALAARGLRPRRTVRAVLFMAEEIGGQGATAYAALAKTEKPFAALESDSGGFSPLGFSLDTDAAGLEKARRFEPYLEMVGAERLRIGGSGADVHHLKPLGALTLGFEPVSRHYFDYHHSANDTIEAVDPRALRDGAAAVAAMTYLLAELP